MDRELAELRRAVSDLGPKRPGRRIPAGLRARLMTTVHERRRGGAGVRELADALGLSVETLMRWSSARGASPTTTDERPLPVVVASPVASLTLVTPGGFRLEGLSVAAAADLLARLR
jgi:transposase-like protein